MRSVKSIFLISQREKGYMQNLKLFLVWFCFLFLGLHWEGMEGSVGPFDANRMGQSLLVRLNSQETPRAGVIGSCVFWRHYFSQMSELKIKFLSVSSLAQMFSLKSSLYTISGVLTRPNSSF